MMIKLLADTGHPAKMFARWFSLVMSVIVMYLVIRL